MQSFRAANHLDIYCHPPYILRGEDHDQARYADTVGELQPSLPAPSLALHHDDAVALSSSSGFAPKSDNLGFPTNNLPYGSLNTWQCIGGGAEIAYAETGHELMYQRGGGEEGINRTTSLGNGHGMENWGDSGMVMVVAPDTNSQHTDTSTDVDADDRTQYNQFHGRATMAEDCTDQSKGRIGDVKTLRRLAQNREAARKSRLRKKAYVQQLENSRIRLLNLEQELQRARQQGMFGSSGMSMDNIHATGSGAAAFDMEYSRWLDDHQRLISELRSAVNTQVSDNELRILVEAVMMHYDEIFRMKSIGAKADVFHMLSGMWKSPAERFFLWLGGFRSSELLKVLGSHLEPLTDQQLMGICNLQQSSQQAEDALSQGMEALQQSLVDTLSSSDLNPTGSGNVADYMGQMAIAMGKLATLENFLHQADLLRQQTLQQLLHRILTTRQAARALLVINDYVSRLRALSSLWLARPKN